MQSKMMAYDRVIAEFNTARLKGTSYPIIHSLINASLSLSASDVCQTIS
jgi:nuclear pore complex protein Nup93